MLPNYEQLIEKIAKTSGLEVDEIKRKVEAKCAKLSGLISKEGSAQIVASELGINFDKEKMKVSELMTGMKRVNLTGKIVEEPIIREFNKNGKEGKVASMKLADDTGNIRLVLWDTNHIQLFEDKKLKSGDVVEISNSSVRNDELHLGGFSDIKLSKEVLKQVKLDKRVLERDISQLKPGENVRLRAVIVQMFEPRFFEVCPECNKKVVDNNCGTHGKIAPLKKALLSVVLDDGTENMRGVIFSEQITKFGFKDEELENPELFLKKKNELLGEEYYFHCNVRNNQLFNNTELIINNTEKIELDSLIESLK